MPRWACPALAALLLVLVTACAGPERRQADFPGWVAHSDSLKLRTHWEASGKLALRTAKQGESGNFLWQQSGDITRLHLSGPLGAGATFIHSDGAEMEIRQGDSVRHLDISTPEAIELGTGWALPLQALPYWLKGLPCPDYKLQRFDLDATTQLLRTLGQDDWEVHYEAYAPFQALHLPTRLRIEGRGTRATLLIRHWQLPTS